MAIDVSYRDTYTTSAEDLARTNKNFIINEGVAFDGFRVTESLTPGMSVLVAPGTAYFYGSGTNANVMYEFYSDANETVTIGTAGVSARIDIICLKVDASTGVASIVAVAGTPSGSPAVPATPASHYKLAEVAVGAGVTTITNANITSTRRSVFVLPTGDRTSGLLGGRIQVTVASNNLTVAVKTLAGADPSTSSPVGIWIGDTLRWITSAMNTTMPAGFNLFNSGSAELATKEADYFVYIGQGTSGGALSVGVARIPYANLGSDMNDTTGSEKYGRFDSANILTANISQVVNIGRFAATLSAGAGYTWSVPTFNANNLIQEPIYETRNLEWAPTYGANGSMTYTSVTTGTALYKITSTDLSLTLLSRGTIGGTPDTNITATIPFAINIGSFSFPTNAIRGSTYVRDAGGDQDGSYYVESQSNSITFVRTGFTNFTAGANTDISLNESLPIKRL